MSKFRNIDKRNGGDDKNEQRDRKIKAGSHLVFSLFIKGKFIPNRAENLESA